MSRAHAAFAALALLAVGCSVLLSTAEPEQCSSNRDCDADPSLRQRVCEEGFCVVPKAPTVPISKEGGEACVSSALCTQANSGKPSVCTKAGGPCTPWWTPDCSTITGEWMDPDAIVIGSIHPFSVKQGGGDPLKLPYADRIRRAIELARDEFATELPLGLVVPGSPPRKLAVVHCDSHFDPVVAQAVMTHLTDVVGVQAVIVGADDDLLAITPKALERKTALVCSDCVGPLPAGTPVWRIIPPLALQAPMAVWRVGVLETEIKAGPTPPAALKVAVLTEPGRAESAFVDAFTSQVTFNGKGAIANGANFKVIKGENPLKQSVSYDGHATDLAAFRPDVIVVAMGTDFPLRYVELIESESRWPADKPKPYYIITDLNYDVTSFKSVLGVGADDLRRRISGTRNGFDQKLQDNIDAFVLRYILPNNGQRPDGNFSGYEAFYAMAYAIAAASSQPLLDGPHISAGFERLRSGDEVNFGPQRIGFAVTLLGGTSSVDVRGLWSNLDWNATTRDLDNGVSMFCFEWQPDGSLGIKPNAGPHLVTSSPTVVTGTYSCN